MPEIEFTDDLDLPGQKGMADFVKLEAKGEKIRFRIANKPHVRGQHWPPGDPPVDCLRVNEDSECEYCIKLEAGELPKNVTEEDVKKDSRKNWYSPSVQFLYPILNRDDGKAAIFQTTTSVHIVIREAAKAGIDVYKSDWQVVRNEGSPANYYSTIRLDPIKLEKSDKEELEAAKNINLELILNGSKASTMEGPGTEEVDPNDVPL